MIDLLPDLPAFTTKRLAMRKFTPDDAEDFHRVESDPQVKQYLEGPTHRDVDYIRESLRAKEPNEPGTSLAATLKENGAYIGRCGFSDFWKEGEWEIDIVLDKAYWRQGYGLELGEALIRHGFEHLKCDKIFGYADAQNKASIELCRRLKMKPTPDMVNRYGSPQSRFVIERSSLASFGNHHPVRW